MAHSNRKSSGEKKRAEKTRRKAANPAYYEALRDSNKNSKRARQAIRKMRKVGHPHDIPCGNIGCMKDSQPARQGYMNLMTRMHGPAFAAKMAAKRGWTVV